jgi:hypothetical protein
MTEFFAFIGAITASVVCVAVFLWSIGVLTVRVSIDRG